jgi:hypothetical protein
MECYSRRIHIVAFVCLDRKFEYNVLENQSVGVRKDEKGEREGGEGRRWE